MCGVFLGRNNTNGGNSYAKYTYASNTNSVTIAQTPYYLGRSSAGTASFGFLIWVRGTQQMLLLIPKPISIHMLQILLYLVVI